MDDFFKINFTQQHIDNFIASHSEESINLDFKRGDALKTDDKTKREIAKDVSAFANSDGGLIIYGIEEKNHSANNLVFVDGNSIKKEWLEQIINSRIQRKIEGLIIEPVRYNQKIDETIYVVKIPRSLDAPHMTTDKKFYKRYNFESVEMEEYEIRGLYNRQEKTSLEIVKPTIKLNPGALYASRPINFYTDIEINIRNKSQTIEKLFKVEIRIPITLTGGIHGYSATSFLKYFVRNEEDYAIYSVANSSPLFQNEQTAIQPFRINLTQNTFQDIKGKPLIIKLLYTNGTEIMPILLFDHLFYNGEKLTFDLLSYR